MDSSVPSAINSWVAVASTPCSWQLFAVLSLVSSVASRWFKFAVTLCLWQLFAATCRKPPVAKACPVATCDLP
eukprot:1514724-Pleurochrysis_carterae.AAC.4